MKKRLNLNETFKNLKSSWKYVKKQKRFLILYGIISIITSILGALIPIISAQVLANITNQSWNLLLKFAILLFVIEFVKSVLSFLSSKSYQMFLGETLLDLQVSIARELLKFETKELDKNSSGIFINRMNNDASDISEIFLRLNSSLNNLLTNAGILVAVFIVNVWIGIYFVVVVCLLFILDKIRIKKFYMSNKIFRKKSENNTGLINELVRGIRDIKILNADDTFLNKASLELKKTNLEKYKMFSIRRKYTALSFIAEDFFSLLFIIICIIFINKNMLEPTSFLVLYMYQDKIYSFLGYFAHILEEIKRFDVSATRVFEIVDDGVYEKEKFGTIELSKIKGDFSFKNVTFGYNQNKKIIKNLNFDVHANETVAFVGKSGAGKTTIFSLLTKLYHPNEGEILIDGYNIEELTKNSLRNNISVITQNPYIFNFSIRENLKLIKPDMTEEEMIEACKTACLHDFILTLENGYDTVIGEGGVVLSGGQRQRLAIARSLLRKTEIILFDEATSALDNETQNSISQAIKNMQGEYTILIIAHRLSTIVNSDRILVIDEGKIVGEGKHRDLLKNNETYKNLYKSEIN